MFEALHGPGYQALIMVDNSQGHSSYAEDALLTSRMNFKPGGKQAQLCNGWYISGGQKVIQEMIFPFDHPKHPDQPKGMKEILKEHGIWKDSLHMHCKEQYDPDIQDCCARHILNHQPDFAAQRSLVQEVIEEAGHLCIVLPKFHCEFNWGVVKHWLQENCDYMFQTLQANLPKAMDSISKELIRKWQHHSFRWMDAYSAGLSAKDAEDHVKKFSSRRYKSHWCVPETLARRFDLI